MGLTKIIGKPNSGKSIYALRKVLESNTTQQTCIITLEVSSNFIKQRVFNYMKNRGLDFNNLENIKFHKMDGSINGLHDYISDKCDEGYTNFLVDTISVVNKGDRTYYQSIKEAENMLYELSKEKGCDIVTGLSPNSKMPLKDLVVESDKLKESENIIYISKTINNNFISRVAYDFRTSDEEAFEVNDFIK